MKSLSFSRLGLGLGLSVCAGLSGCDRLWNVALVCPDGSQLTADSTGNVSCLSAGADLGGSTADGGTAPLTPWTPTPVSIATTLTAPVSGLRVVRSLVTSSPTSLFVFYQNKTTFDVASFGCAGTTATLGPPPRVTLNNSVIYDANYGVVGNQTPYYYVIYQGATGMMSIVPYSVSTGVASTAITMPGATQPGYSNLETYSTQSYLSIVRTDSPVVMFGAISGDKITPNSSVMLNSGTTDPIAQVARADFNQDGLIDFALSQYQAGTGGALVACSTTVGMVGCMVPPSTWSKGDLITAGNFAALPAMLVRVDRALPMAGTSGTAAVGLSNFVGAPSLVTMRSMSYSLPMGYTPLFVAAAASNRSGALTILIAAAFEERGTYSVFAHQVDHDGLLIGQADKLELDGMPTAMITGEYPCDGHQQLIVAQTVNGASEVKAYELPAF